jgi:hypothetical protein
MSEVQAQSDNVALIAAILSVVGWIIPVVGIPLSAVGLFLARKGNTTKRAVIVGICLLTFMAGAVNAAIGASRGYQNGIQLQQHILGS